MVVRFMYASIPAMHYTGGMDDLIIDAGDAY